MKDEEEGEGAGTTPRVGRLLGLLGGRGGKVGRQPTQARAIGGTTHAMERLGGKVHATQL